MLQYNKGFIRNYETRQLKNVYDRMLSVLNIVFCKPWTKGRDTFHIVNFSKMSNQEGNKRKVTNEQRLKNTRNVDKIIKYVINVTNERQLVVDEKT